MGCKMIGMVLAMVLVVSLCGGAMAEPECIGAIAGMSSCITFFTENSTTPPDSCCTQITDVVQSQPQCLCDALNGIGLSHGIQFNRTLALSLPGACDVQTPTVSKCKSPFDLFDADSPEGSGDPEQGPLPEEDPSDSDSPSGSKTAKGSELRAPIHLLVFVLFVVSWTFTTTSF